MAFILTDGLNNSVTYPYSIGLLRRDNPSVSFPATMSNAQLAEWNVYPVIDQPQPTIDTLLEYITEGTPVYSGGDWLQTWVVNTYTTQEQSNVLTQFQNSAAQTAASLFEETNKYITQSLTEGLELHQDLIDYRTALMDPASLPGYPNQITWPTFPASPFVGAGATKVVALDVESIAVTGTLTVSSTPLTNDSVATKEYVDNSIADLVDSSPTTLNTLNELAAALGDDANFATTVATQLGLKANSADVTLALSTKANTTYVDTELGSKLSLSGGTMSGEIDMGFQKIVGLATPEWPQDAVNKQYVDDSVNVSGDDLIAVFEQGLM